MSGLGAEFPSRHGAGCSGGAAGKLGSELSEMLSGTQFGVPVGKLSARSASSVQNTAGE